MTLSLTSATEIPFKRHHYYLALLLAVLCILLINPSKCMALSSSARSGSRAYMIAAYRSYSPSAMLSASAQRRHCGSSQLRCITSSNTGSIDGGSHVPQERVDASTPAEALKRAEALLPNGVFAVYKPTNISSNNAIMKLKRIIYEAVRDATGYQGRIKVKIGHGGTLDPLAEGVLVVGIGKGTKQLSSYLSGAKGYIAEGLLGQERATLDSTGAVTEELPCTHVTVAAIATALAPFRGYIKQTPPMFSALHHEGRRLYDLAREGIEVERAQRDVYVHSLALLTCEADALPEGGSDTPYTLPRFGLHVECGGGFYVRSLVSDLGRSVGSCAHMTKLVRTKQGAFGLLHALPESRWSLADIASSIDHGKKLLEEELDVTSTTELR